MTLTVRPARDRGHAEHGWLSSRHSFSFAHYFDPAHMGFRSLRVINDDTVAPGAGFPTHGHRDMEIVTYVVSGSLEHRDSAGNHAVLPRGGVQQMTAGSGIRHSEYNASDSEPLRLLQIWILPQRDGLTPGHTEAQVSDEAKRGRLTLIAAPGGDGVLPLHQDARVYAAILADGETVRHAIAPGRGVWIQLVSGALRIGDVALAEGDGLAVEDAAEISIAAVGGAEFLLFDLA
ncbi:pirin family protein [Oleispirillum naphthae]|uniref:pirin family protein n=1 Tax=Oleispirillum naphthae TaxID=2838853 RepID=UPI0030824E7A